MKINRYLVEGHSWIGDCHQSAMTVKRPSKSHWNFIDFALLSNYNRDQILPLQTAG